MPSYRGPKHVPEHRPFEIHYFYDARLSYPSDIRSFPKREESARAAAIVRIEAEQFNKALIVDRDTRELLHTLRRDPNTGAIWREDHHYRKFLGESKQFYGGS